MTMMKQYAEKNKRKDELTELLKNNMDMIKAVTNSTKEEILDPEFIEDMLENYITATKAVAKVKSEEELRMSLAGAATMIAILVNLMQEVIMSFED